jgi:hypothetical protein
MREGEIRCPARASICDKKHEMEVLLEEILGYLILPADVVVGF